MNSVSRYISKVSLTFKLLIACGHSKDKANGSKLSGKKPDGILENCPDLPAVHFKVQN